MNQRTEGTAIASLVLSILSVFIGPLGYIPGIVLGHIARARIRSQPELGGDSLALAGLITGYVFFALTVVAIILFFVFFAVIMGTAPQSP